MSLNAAEKQFLIEMVSIQILVICVQIVFCRKEHPRNVIYYWLQSKHLQLHEESEQTTRQVFVTTKSHIQVEHVFLIFSILNDYEGG